MNRDYRRTRPVESGCVWCKKTEADASEDTEFHDISTGERICSACIGDLRWFKRNIKSQFVLSDEFDADVSGEMFAHVQQGENDILGLNGVSVEGTTNAEREEKEVVEYDE